VKDYVSIYFQYYQQGKRPIEAVKIWSFPSVIKELLCVRVCVCVCVLKQCSISLGKERLQSLFICCSVVLVVSPGFIRWRLVRKSSLLEQSWDSSNKVRTYSLTIKELERGKEKQIEKCE
jgi:hypothetical protein